MKLITRMICLLLVPVLTTGCIKENLDDCVENVSVSFRYNADGDTDVLRSYMDKIDLYVFDAENRLVRQITYSQDDLKKDEHTLPARLTPGTYTLVALGNVYDRTRVEGLGSTDFGNIFIQHPGWGTSDDIDSHDHNYMGRQEITVGSGNQLLHASVRLYSSHINVSVEIHGLPAPDADTRAASVPYRLSIEGVNARTDFNNTVSREQTAVCLPLLDYDTATGTYHTDDGLALFRMDSNGQLDAALCRHRLCLTDADGTTLADFNVYDYLTENRQTIDVTRQEADLPVSIVFTPLGVTIEIPGWYVEDVLPDWTK